MIGARRAWLAGVALTACIGVAATAAVRPQPTVAQAPAAAAGGDAVLPALGPAGERSVVFGAVTAGEQAGDTWAYEQLPIGTPVPRVGGEPVPFATTPEARPEPQLALLRHRPQQGWQIVDVPRAADGAPIRGFVPNRRSARMSERGAAILLGQDSSRPATEQIVLTVRPAGGRFTELQLPAPPLLQAAEDPAPGDAAEAVAGDRGIGRVSAAIADQPGREAPLVMLAVQGRPVEQAVLVHDGDDWQREPLELTGAPPSQLRIIAIAASAPQDAWLVASGDGGAVQLFQRDAAAGTWRPVELPTHAFTDEGAALAAGLEGVEPLSGAAQTLTPSGSRVWLDVTAREGEVERHATMLIDPSQPVAARIRTWCDLPAASCDHPLRLSFSADDGYRSFAWPGAGGDDIGDRVITNPLRAPGDAASNQGAWALLSGTRFARRAGGGGNFRPGGAFHTPQRGWLDGPVELGAAEHAAPLVAWPVPLRAPLTAVAGEPGTTPGAIDGGAVAVGVDGAVLRHVPQQGWSREFLLSSTGSVVRQTLRGVSWPEPARAHAVGDLGAMWQWRADTGLWERDPAAPIGVEANFTAIAFDPADPQRGFATGKEGTLLAYGKTWEQQPLPPGFAEADFTAVAFAGRQAIAVSSAGVLVQDPGGAWRTDEALTGLLDALPGPAPRLVAAAGLADGGAALGGRGLVVLRDGASAPWRTAAQPLAGVTVSAIAAIRDGERVRSVVSVVPGVDYPTPDPELEIDPDAPAPLVPPSPLPGDGYLLRETADGWEDEQRAAFAGGGKDRPSKSDPVLALLLAANGDGWAVGGWTGLADSAGRGVSGTGGGVRQVRERVQTGAVLRYRVGGSPAAAGAAAGEAEIPLPPGKVRFAIGGHPQCAGPCAELSSQALGPDRMVRAALDLAQRLAAQPGGPRAFLSTGGRVPAGTPAAGDEQELVRAAQLLQPRLGLPVFNAVAAGDVTPGASGGAASAGFRAAFASGTAPQGSEASIVPSTDGLAPGASADPQDGARTHFAFDSRGPGGAVRVIVIDNSAGSLAASDPHQNPNEPQEPWLIAQLQDARADGLPAIVIGSRDLNSGARPALNVAEDADRVAQLLVEHGASAYFYDRPEENRSGQIPAGGATTIPTFGTGTLGYRSGVDDASSLGLPDALFGDGGILLAEIDAERRDPATNRAPVSVRLIPVIESLALNAVDGTLLRRSRPALLQGIGRRPVAGDRWGPIVGGGLPSPTGADPYTSFPADPCLISGCSTRIAPEYRFSSSAPDVLDFVAVDPASPNPRKPLLGADDKVISDPVSGLVCPFNAGTTTVTVTAGGKAVSQQVTVLPGSVLRPCGTRPLDPSRIRTQTAAPAGAATPPPPASAPPAVLPALVPPPPPAPADAPQPRPQPRPEPPAAAPLFGGFAVAAIKAGPGAPGTPPPPAPGFFAQPIPPGGATVRVTEEKRETEVATEQSQAYAAITADDRLPVEPFIAGLALVAALAGTTIRPGRRRGPAYARVRTHTTTRPPRRRRL